MGFFKNRHHILGGNVRAARMQTLKKSEEHLNIGTDINLVLYPCKIYFASLTVNTVNISLPKGYVMIWVTLPRGPCLGLHGGTIGRQGAQWRMLTRDLKGTVVP